jgi:Sec-independent protein translocase protein TatA
MVAVGLALIIMIILIMIGYKRFIKREAKLVEEIKEERTEIEALKEKFEDKMPETTTPKESTPERPKTEK